MIGFKSVMKEEPLVEAENIKNKRMLRILQRKQAKSNSFQKTQIHFKIHKAPNPAAKDGFS